MARASQWWRACRWMSGHVSPLPQRSSWLPSPASAGRAGAFRLSRRCKTEAADMAASGTWNLLMQTPIGERKATLTLQGTGTLTGTLAAEGSTTQIFDGQETGGAVTFKASI